MIMATRTIDAAFGREEWETARTALRQELARDPENHWLLTRLAMTYYEQRDYKKALKISVTATQIAPGCPLVRWDRACILDMLNQTTTAIAEWKKLLKAGPSAIGGDECGEGVEWAQSLLNDCRYRIAFSSMDIQDYGSAVRYLRNYLVGRTRGISSIYDEVDARDKLNICLAARGSLLNRG